MVFLQLERGRFNPHCFVRLRTCETLEKNDNGCQDQTVAPFFALSYNTPRCEARMPCLIRPSRRGPKLALAYFSCFWSLLTFLVLSCGVPALAEWVAIGEEQAGQVSMTYYVDPDTIRRKGELVKMWFLADSKSPEGIVGSSKQQREYDCAEDSHRHLATLSFSGHMGKGRLIARLRDISEWYSVEPGTMQQTLWKVACGKQ